MTKDDFPGAPAHAYVCEDGWLVVDDEAWTRDEWLNPRFKRGRFGRIGRPPRTQFDSEAQRRKYELDRMRSREKYAARKAGTA